MVALNNVYASDIDKLVNWMKTNKEVINNPELKCLMERMEHDIHWLKLGKYQKIESVPKTDTLSTKI